MRNGVCSIKKGFFHSKEPFQEFFFEKWDFPTRNPHRPIWVSTKLELTVANPSIWWAFCPCLEGLQQMLPKWWRPSANIQTKGVKYLVPGCGSTPSQHYGPPPRKKPQRHTLIEPSGGFHEGTWTPPKKAQLLGGLWPCLGGFGCELANYGHALIGIANYDFDALLALN